MCKDCTRGRSLYEIERQSRLSGVIGNESTKRLARNLIASRRFRPGVLISGDYGCGKSMLAKILARAMVCRNPVGQDGCGVCDRCRYYPHSTAMWGEGISVRNCADYSVAQLKKDFENALYASPEDPLVQVLDEFHRAKNEFPELLLTRLEDETLNFILIVITPMPDKIDPPLAQRLLSLKMKPPSPDELAAHLSAVSARHALGVPLEEIRAICAESRCVPREALNRLQRAALSR